ncbi:hypothetical protein SDC9_07410 [bioreactor metagenome]|uniref:YqbQ/XkdQ domain-containing protein n=1 Tax=bioreactor metagenome TaxID=1076179 RepID=A0A644T7D2_9ZZZZ|nr:hypothetical protein [Methanobrevibacter sp.]MEA4956865.1 hypothetical protein [Methanobrevibacter sp.]
MTSKLYTRYQELDEVDKNSNEFKEVPIFNDWSIKRDWNKAGSLTFKSPTYLTPGTHVKLVSTDHKTFGGQIVKKTEDSSDFYSYDCLDYKRFLLTSVSTSHTNQTSSQIINFLFKKYLQNIGGLFKFKISKTKTVFPSLSFQDKTILDIISNLLNLEYKKGTLIFFDVDENANLTWKPYPQKVKGYSLSMANKYTNSLDYSDIITGAVLVDTDLSSIRKIPNKYLQNIWGVIDITKTLAPENTTSNEGNKNDKEIKKIVLEVNKSFRNIKWARTCTSDTSKCDTLCNGSTMECRGMSCRIFKKLKDHKVPCKIVRYPSSAASSGYHDSVLVKYSTGWKDFDYKGMDSSFGPISSLSKKAPARIIYKGD